jgi:hypothetical protein
MMKTILFSLSLFILFHAQSQTNVEKEITSLLQNQFPKSHLHFDVFTGNCALFEKKDIEVLFHRHAIPVDQTKSELLNRFSLLASLFISRNVLIRYPQYDCLTISMQTDGSDKKESLIFYLLAGKILYDDHGKARDA